MSRATTEPTDVAEGVPDGRATRWNDHTARRRQKILDAAIALVQKSGGEVSVRDIAARARVPRSVVYRIFRDRDDLDEQLRTEIVANLMAVLAPVLEPQGTVREAIEEAATTYVDWVAENPLLHQFLGTGSTKRRTTGSRVVTGTRTAIARRVEAMLATAAVNAEADATIAEPLAFGLVGMVDGAVNRWVNHADTRVSADTLATFLAESIWTMLAVHAKELGLELTPDTRINDLL